MRYWKIHLFAVCAIIVGVTGAFYISGRFNETPSKPHKKVITTVPKKISITEASWGLNCRERIKNDMRQIREEMRHADQEEYESLQSDLEALPDMPERNNVLQKMRESCGGKPQCEITPKHELFDIQPHDHCSYKLDLTYQCFTFDRLRRMSVFERDPATLDCRNVELP